MNVRRIIIGMVACLALPLASANAQTVTSPTTTPPPPSQTNPPDKGHCGVGGGQGNTGEPGDNCKCFNGTVNPPGNNCSHSQHKP